VTRKSHTWFDRSTNVHRPRAGWTTRAQARAACKAIREMTGRTFVPFRCRELRMLSRSAAEAHEDLARSA